MKIARTYPLFIALILFFAACNQGQNNHTTKKAAKRKPINYANYIIQIATYKTNKGVKEADLAKMDSVINLKGLQKEAGFISKENGVDNHGNWLLVVAWDNDAHAEAARIKFEQSPKSDSYNKLIDTASISQKRFTVTNDQSNSTRDEKPYVIELATFKEKSQVQRDTFEKRDKQVEADYISRQTGYITRRIGIAQNGERLMMIYWKTQADADAGMEAFLKEQSVADYNKMIDWKTVEMKRFKAL